MAGAPAVPGPGIAGCRREGIARATGILHDEGVRLLRRGDPARGRVGRARAGGRVPASCGRASCPRGRSSFFGCRPTSVQPGGSDWTSTNGPSSPRWPNCSRTRFDSPLLRASSRPSTTSGREEHRAIPVRRATVDHRPAASPSASGQSPAAKSGMVMVPSSSNGNPGLCAIAQTCPSGSVKQPAWPP